MGNDILIGRVDLLPSFDAHVRWPFASFFNYQLNISLIAIVQSHFYSMSQTNGMLPPLASGNFTFKWDSSQPGCVFHSSALYFFQEGRETVISLLT